MLPSFKQKTFSLPDGTSITIETGKLAKQADGSAVIKVGDMMLLATVVSKKTLGIMLIFFHYRLIIKRNSLRQEKYQEDF